MRHTLLCDKHNLLVWISPSSKRVYHSSNSEICNSPVIFVNGEPKTPEEILKGN